MQAHSCSSAMQGASAAPQAPCLHKQPFPVLAQPRPFHLALHSRGRVCRPPCAERGDPGIGTRHAGGPVNRGAPLVPHSLSPAIPLTAPLSPAPAIPLPLLVPSQSPQHLPTPQAPAPPASPAPGPASPPSTSVQVLAPGPNYISIANTGAAKAALPAWKSLLGGILAGAYIAFGGLMLVSVGGSIPGVAAANPGLQKLIMGLVFPVNILMVTICGAELYTGNTAVMSVALFEGKAKLSQVLKGLLCSFVGNWIGCFGIAAAVAATGLLATNPLPEAMAVAKTSLDVKTAFIRAILCNWLVCMAVWMAASATSLPGKVLGLWPPVVSFVAIGLEHSIANMFFISLGIMLGAQVTFAQLWTSNLIPVTLGNTVAGVLCVALPYALLYGGLGQKLQSALQPEK